MIQRLAAIFSIEFRVLSRNRWLAVAIFVMIAFSLLIAFAGSAPIGTVAAERLTVTAASLGTLMVYVVPLIALLISYDSVSGEASRGTLALLLVYPATRTEILAGKWIAQFLVIVVAIVAGTGSAALLVAMTELPSSEALSHLIRLVWSACLLGAVFLSIGSCISASTREPGAAAAVAIATWILVVVMLDVALLAALVNDDGGAFTQQVFPWILIASPTDAFRLFNLSQIDAHVFTSGLSGISGTAAIPAKLALLSLLLWPLLAMTGAVFLFRRYQT